MDFSLAVPVVACWRGVWLLLDIYIYPENRRLSGWISGCIGFTVYIIDCIIKYAFRKRRDMNLNHPNAPTTAVTAAKTPKVKSYKKIYDFILTRAYTLLLGFGVVNTWRWFWYVLDEYLLPNLRETSAWISIGSGVAVLLIFGILRSILAAPALYARDNESPISFFTSSANTDKGIELTDTH